MRKVIFFTILFLLATPLAYASEVKVNISNNSSGSSSNVNVDSTSEGTSTTCVNGKCTTTGGSSRSKVCINGECTETDGDVDIKKDDGDTHVYISNSGTKNSSVAPTGTLKKDDVSSKSADDKNASEEAKKTIEKIQKDKGSILEMIRNIFRRIFGF